MPEQRQEARIGEQDALAVNQHRVVHRLDQPLEELLAIVQSRAALLEILEQLVDRAAQLPERLRLALEADASRRALVARELRDLAWRTRRRRAPGGASRRRAHRRPRLK